MAKSSLEQMLKKQVKEAEKRARNQARQQQASSVVNGQPMVGKMRIMDISAEEVLKVFLQEYDKNEFLEVNINTAILPPAYRYTVCDELERLKLYGMIAFNSMLDLSGNIRVTLTPSALTYFEDKERACEEEKMAQSASVHIENLIASGSNVVLGDVINSTISIDNSVQRIEKEIEDKGGADAEELRAILEEVKEYIDNLEESKHVAKNKGLFSKLSNHLEKHGWFYGEIVGLLGAAVLQIAQG